MTKGWTYRSTQDKLCIFVSSRLQECKAERVVVSEAINSLNLQPILFEHMGAKSYSPRDLYLSRLSDSQVMIAIYRLGYGYIDKANAMKVSGLEDELRFARKLGLDILFYIWHSNEGREPELVQMINEIQNGRYTISFYSRPDSLRDRVRQDLTSLMTDRFLASRLQAGVLQETSKNLLKRTSNQIGVLVKRDDVVEALKSVCKEFPITCVHGDAGIGKTTLAAQFAENIGAVFLRVTDLAPKDLFGVCASALVDNSSETPSSYSTLQGAHLAFAAAWAETTEAVLVIDECEFVAELIAAITAGGGTSSKKMLIYTSRDPSNTFNNFAVPPMNLEQSREIVQNSVADKSIELSLVDTGNPLHLKEALLQQRLTPTLENLGDLKGTAGELLRYLALSDQPLSVSDLLFLRGDEAYSIDNLYRDIGELGELVDDTPRGFSIIHDEISATIAESVSRSAQRYGFYLKRLIRLFDKVNDYRRAYEISLRLADGSEQKYATAAAQYAARVGDWKFGTKLLDQQLANALDKESKAEALHLMLSLIYPLELMGDSDRADALLDKALPIAEALGQSAISKLDEARITSNARRSLSIKDVTALEKIYVLYGERKQFWDQARIGLELSAIYMAAKEYEKATEILRPTLQSFEDLGDEYGHDLAERNLASSLSAIPGCDAEAEKLIKRIEERSQDEPDARRQRAWLCNILTRRFRQAGRLIEAENTAQEAITIGAELGDEYLGALNSLNLGNVYRDMERADSAIASYEAAAIAAKNCSRQDIEADASRLVAGIYNDLVTSDVRPDRFQSAKFYAEHAISLLHDTLNHDSRARAFVELGDAYKALSRTEEAIAAYFDAADNFSKAADPDSFETFLVHAASLALPDHVDLYLARMATALETIDLDTSATLTDQFLQLVPRMIASLPRTALISLLGEHIYEVGTHIPSRARSALAIRAIEIFTRFVHNTSDESKSWRTLYTGIALASSLPTESSPFLFCKLANAITGLVPDLFVREEGNGYQVWTVILNLNHRVTITIAPLDDSHATRLACFALAMFVKGFESELAQDLVGGLTYVNELVIQVANSDFMPDDLRATADSTLGLHETLNHQPCVVTRPTDFRDATPTVVFLAGSFADQIAFASERSRSLQMLFGMTLVELTYQLLRGELEMEELRPKVLALVRKTM